MKIYLVEDDEVIVSVIQKQLEQWNYQVVSAADFHDILGEFQRVQPELVLMDIGLPYFNGFHWCQKIREVSEVPLIFLSSAEDKMNQIMAMNLGADDFIAKPVDLSLLLAKIQAILRRSYQYGQHSQVYPFAAFVFDPAANQIKSPTDKLTLSPNESRILNVLFQKQGQIVPRERLIEELWQNDEFIDNNALAVNITRLRKKLASFGIEDLIQTVKNKGYLIEEREG